MRGILASYIRQCITTGGEYEDCDSIYAEDQ